MIKLNISYFLHTVVSPTAWNSLNDDDLRAPTLSTDGFRRLEYLKQTRLFSEY